MLVKKFYLIVFLSFGCLLSKGQDCEALKNITGYHGIKFGQALPKNILDNKTSKEQLGDLVINLWIPTISNLIDSKKQLDSSILEFDGEKFDIIGFICGAKNNELYGVNIIKSFTDLEKLKSTLNSLITSLNMMFGKSSYINKSKTGELMKWYCDSSDVSVGISYDISNDKSGTLNILFSDYKLIQKYKNSILN